jgi:hypothetical protein
MQPLEIRRLQPTVLGFILLPLKLRPPLRHGPEWTEEVGMAAEFAEPIERWTAKRRWPW